MDVEILKTPEELGRESAKRGAALIRDAIAEKGEAAIILATGASQFDTLAALIQEKDIDWSKVTAFHLDEYVGMGTDHPASFVKYLKERFHDKVTDLKAFVYVDGAAADMDAEIARLSREIGKVVIDVAFVGIGENGHLAFNDPPADFETEEPYMVVKLDDACRRQQMGEGWFATFEDVPEQAVSMSIRQIMKSKAIICSVPDERKANAVKCAVDGPVSNMCPSSILQDHPATWLFLDETSAQHLERRA